MLHITVFFILFCNTSTSPSILGHVYIILVNNTLLSGNKHDIFEITLKICDSLFVISGNNIHKVKYMPTGFPHKIEFCRWDKGHIGKSAHQAEPTVTSLSEPWALRVQVEDEYSPVLERRLWWLFHLLLLSASLGIFWQLHCFSAFVPSMPHPESLRTSKISIPNYFQPMTSI